MTPKEKAEDLVEKFWNTDVELRLSKWERKQCALIAVDEMIAADWYIPTSEDLNKWTSYWEQVKEEIEKL